jgi:hypothetical protein
MPKHNRADSVSIGPANPPPEAVGDVARRQLGFTSRLMLRGALERLGGQLQPGERVGLLALTDSRQVVRAGVGAMIMFLTMPAVFMYQDAQRLAQATGERAGQGAEQAPGSAGGRLRRVLVGPCARGVG